MAFEFRPATRESVGLVIGLSAGTGGGKTYSAMRLAKGICGDKKFAVIDTEAGRAKHYADRFSFDHGDLRPPFTPARYAEAIKAADDAHYPAIIVDSTSHEWAGEGGVLDMQEEELFRMAKDDYIKRESCKMASWIKPKLAHKQMVQRLLQVRAHLILCFRAEPKVDMVRGQGGRMEVVAKKGLTARDGWFPICEKNLPYELTASFLLMAEHPGRPLAIKLEAQHRELFPEHAEINEACGARLAAWASGGVPPSTATVSSDQDPTAVDRFTYAIENTTTLEDLKAISLEVKKLPRAKQELLRGAYTNRYAQLKMPPLPVLPPADMQGREPGEEG